MSQIKMQMPVMMGKNIHQIKEALSAPALQYSCKKFWSSKQYIIVIIEPNDDYKFLDIPHQQFSKS